MVRAAGPLGRLLGLVLLAVLGAAASARAQQLTVLPVTIEMGPNQAAAALTLTNEADQPTSFQVRPFVWTMADGKDQLAPTDALLVSPPLGTVAPRASQIIRLVLRQPPQGQEATYRLLLDEIPPPAAPGTVRMALRLSLPVFAEPATRVSAQLQWRVVSGGAEADLTCRNAGTRHEKVFDIALTGGDGAPLKAEPNVSPYILAGAERRWRLQGRPPPPGTTIRLVARGDGGDINQAVPVVAGP